MVAFPPKRRSRLFRDFNFLLFLLIFFKHSFFINFDILFRSEIRIIFKLKYFKFDIHRNNDTLTKHTMM